MKFSRELAKYPRKPGFPFECPAAGFAHRKPGKRHHPRVGRHHGGLGRAFEDLLRHGTGAGDRRIPRASMSEVHMGVNEERGTLWWISFTGKIHVPQPLLRWFQIKFEPHEDV